jgi:hypothetical protein
MDYTLTPSNNLEPGQYNFELLQEIYGVISETSAAVGIDADITVQEDSTLVEILDEFKQAIKRIENATSPDGNHWEDLGNGFQVVAAWYR